MLTNLADSCSRNTRLENRLITWPTTNETAFVGWKLSPTLTNWKKIFKRVIDFICSVDVSCTSGVIYYFRSCVVIFKRCFTDNLQTNKKKIVHSQRIQHNFSNRSFFVHNIDIGHYLLGINEWKNYPIVRRMDIFVWFSYCVVLPLV